MFKKIVVVFSMMYSVTVMSQIPTQLATTWNKFQLAIENDNIEALSKITHFPLRSNDFGGDLKSSDSLKSKYKLIFSDYVKQKIKKKCPTRIKGYNGYAVDCSDPSGLAIVLGFEKCGKIYLFTYIDNANE
ncbi:MAG: hypothetical protein HXX12_14145 [Geothrix sp.]|uniref:hypothetical protein n=1 Tax=Geothrix sp. TaxID=1962974 RepID=UPI0018570619|nr:hypothetical protein [Geothrix sp.]NWJ42100.1 hypothetical protein [Geothrix sp.]WIL19932.1 MAG: hypothetical protein QOZ81_002471 [Geothrix sp.]